MINQNKFAFLETVVLFIGISGCLLMKIDSKQPKPYMDEIFHITQAQKYCKGDFMDWDPMITTLPGLYVFSLTVIQPVTWLFDIPMKTVCTTFWLRSTNVAFAVANLVILALLLQIIHKKESDPVKCLVTATALSMLPVLYFFTFLYYTDPGSTFFVLLTYLLSLYGNHTMAASTGSLAVFFRQTNIVWIAFCAVLIVGEHLQKFVLQENKNLQEKSGIEKDAKFIAIAFKQVLFQTKISQLLKLLKGIILETWTYITVGISFIVFVILNGSIVVGAKDDHQAGLHFPQLLYYSAFCGVFSCIYFITFKRMKGFLRFLYRKPLIALILMSFMFILIWKFTFAHKYLLADNRHYTFYVWSKIYMRHEYIKYILIPAYLFAYWNIVYSVKDQTIFWTLAYFACLTINLVPSMLLEFRYFIIPYIIFRLNSPLPSYWKLTCEILLNIIINIATLYMFMERPFTWEHDGSVQRFMW